MKEVVLNSLSNFHIHISNFKEVGVDFNYEDGLSVSEGKVACKKIKSGYFKADSVLIKMNIDDDDNIKSINVTINPEIEIEKL